MTEEHKHEWKQLVEGCGWAEFVCEGGASTHFDTEDFYSKKEVLSTDLVGIGTYR